MRFCWCTDGPFDVRDFVVKQCFISKVRTLRRLAHGNQLSHILLSPAQIAMPSWIKGDVMDVRKVVVALLEFIRAPTSKVCPPRMP